jgi:hypothetical protein
MVGIFNAVRAYCKFGDFQKGKNEAYYLLGQDAV